MMNILYSIGIYLLASSFIMIAFVWIKHIKHIRSGYDEIQETNDVIKENPLIKESFAA